MLATYWRSFKKNFFLTEILRFHSRTDWLRFTFHDKSQGSIPYIPVYGSSRLSNHIWKFRSNFWTSATVLLYCRCQVNFCAYGLNWGKTKYDLKWTCVSLPKNYHLNSCTKNSLYLQRTLASNVRMGGQFERYCFSCSLRHDDVLRIVPQVVFLFRRSIIFLNNRKLWNRWHWWWQSQHYLWKEKFCVMHARLKPRVDHLFRKYLFVFYAKIIYQFLDHFEVNETPWVCSTPTIMHTVIC